MLVVVGHFVKGIYLSLCWELVLAEASPVFGICGIVNGLMILFS